MNRKKCKHCQEHFRPEKPLQHYCLAEECVKEWLRSLKDKQWKARKKELQEDLETHGELESKLQLEINKLVRAIDFGSFCMMCDKPMKKENACHYHSVGANNSLRFNLFNNWIGCNSCNSDKGGNIIGYDETLIKYYGRDKWEYIKFDIKREYQYIKLSKEELREKIKEVRSILKKIEKEKKKRTLSERWSIRKELNEQIGIYG